MICTECVETETQENLDNNSTKDNSSVPKSLVLRLKSSKKVKSPKSITWDPSVIDNEFLNKKKSKSCCVYCQKSKPHPFNC